MNKIYSYHYILASGSPRRKELLAGLDLDFRTDTSCPVDEIVPKGTPVEEIPQYLARLKSEGYTHPIREDEILITSDTLVICPHDGQELPLGKPQSREEAIQMLQMLSDKTHRVLSGVCLRKGDGRTHSFTAISEVTFKKLNTEEIDYYVDHYRPYDKAGAYAIQEWIGYIGITQIKGSYFNIVGLPVQKLYTELQKFI